MGVVKHPFTSAIADSGVSTEVSSGEWNADHTVTLTAADVGAATSGHTHVHSTNTSLLADDHTQYTKETERLLVSTLFKVGTLTVAAGALRWYNDFGAALTVRAVRASVGTAPTGASVIVDVNENGTTMYTTQGNRPTIAISTNTVDATLPDDVTLADNNYITIDVDQIGSTIAGADLTVQVWLSIA